MVPPSKDDTVDKLLAAWRKAKAASEELERQFREHDSRTNP